MNDHVYKWPRLRDLPEPQRSLFADWLAGQTRPEVKGVPDADQEFYYSHDYDRWKNLQRVGWEAWD